jgi:zinc protease
MSTTRKFSFILLAGLLITTTSFAQQLRKIDFEKYTLPNGLKVILHKDNTVPVVAVTVSYHVGSKNEDTARTGFAHFFEHLLFEGSANIKRGEFDKYLTNAGGAMNANTWFDRTFYYELLPSNQLALGLWLESERLMHAKIEDIGVNTQREVVKEEKRLRVDNQPYGTMITELIKRAFKNHPYNWSTIGSMEHLNAAKLDEFMKFYRTYYVPNNAILSIAGDIDISQTKRMVEQYFGAIPKGGEVPRPKITETPLGGEIRDVIEDNVQLPAVIHGYRAPTLTSPDYYAFELIASMLSGSPSARLNKTLIDEKQLAASASAFPLLHEDGGLFIADIKAAIGVKPEDVERELDAVINNLKTTTVSDRELQKVKNQALTDFVSGNATMAGIAENLADYEMYYGDANLINTAIEKYNKVTAADIKRVANKYLNKDNRVVLYYLPKSKDKAAAGKP